MYRYDDIVLVKRLLRSKMLVVTNMSDITKATPRGCDNDSLMNGFGVLIQGLLAVVAFSTLMCTWELSKGDCLSILYDFLQLFCVRILEC